MCSSLLGLWLVGTLEFGALLGGAMPFGNLESNLQGGNAFQIVLGYGLGRSRLELTNDFTRLPGSTQPAYLLDIHRISLGYGLAVLYRPDWEVRAGLHLGWNTLTRRLQEASETGAVPGAVLDLTYTQQLGRPKFLCRLFGIELVDPGSNRASPSAFGATVLGAGIGVGYELF